MSLSHGECANLGTSTTYSETSSRAAIEKKVCILEKWSLRNCRIEVKWSHEA